ncbi:hypothetical protein Tco_1029967 [Tanacetum coccineum]|uniref:Uncharacterized protein n=1 Tax=Tanacetum coccineum TaxID=301880 RepID=A0ABQ5G4X5_9ASTR
MNGPSTAEEKICKKNDVKARSLLLMALPNEHQLTFNQYVDAQSMFVAIKARFGGNEATKRTQKALLKQQYENFNASNLNVKFLRSLPSEWDTHVVVWMNKPDFDTMGLDDLYNNFKIVEQKVKKSTADNNDDKNLAFLTTSSPSSTNTINTVNTGVSTGTTKVNTASTETSTASFSDATVYAFLSTQPQGSQLVHEDLEQLHDDDLEEMDLKWNMALLSMRARKFYQRTGRKIIIDGSSTAGYDKQKVEMFQLCQTMRMMLSLSLRLKRIMFIPTDTKKSCLKPETPVRRSVRSFNTDRPSYNAHQNPPVHCARPRTHFQISSTINYSKAPLQENSINKKARGLMLFKPSACWVWKPIKPNGASLVLTNIITLMNEDDPNFKDFDGGYVTFGGGAMKAELRENDKLGKFDGKSDEGFLDGYSLSSKAFWVIDILRTEKFRENCDIVFLENKPMIKMEMVQSGCIQVFLESSTSCQQDQDWIAMPIWKDASYFGDASPNIVDDAQIEDKDELHDEDDTTEESHDGSNLQNNGTADQQINTARQEVNTGSREVSTALPEVNTYS